MRIFLRLIALAIAAGCGAVHAAVVTPVDLPFAGGTRHYLMARPDRIAPGQHPLVLLFHGHVGSGALVLGQKSITAPMSVWLEIADREQLLVIAPDGVKGSDGQTGWNDCRADAETSPHSDDTGFVNAIIDKAIAEDDADPSRVYVMGVSNGAGMVLRLASEIAPRLAGFAATALSVAAKSACPPPSVPLSAFFVAGTSDKVAPYEGGNIQVFPLRGRGSVIGVDQSVAIWRKLDQLPDTAVASPVPHRSSDDPTRATRFAWGHDPHQLQVKLLKIDNGGHAEPSISKRTGWLLTKFLGPQNGDVELAEEVWEFFKDKRRGLAPSP